MMKFILLLIWLFAPREFAHANVVGVDTQNFNPINDGLDFVTVQSSKTLSPGLLNFGFFLNYAVNSLPNYENSVTQSRTNFRDSLLSSDTNFGLGVARGIEVGLSFPALLAQKVSSDQNTLSGYFSSTGVTEFRMMSKFHLLGGRDGGLAFVFTENFNEIQNDPFLGKGAGPTSNFELATDAALPAGMAWAFNAGYRLRSPGTPIATVPVQPFGNEYIASTAFSYLLPSWKSKLIMELFGSYPSGHQQFISDRNRSSLEGLVGMKTDLTRRLAWHIGAGTQVIHGTSAPDWRAYTGINWVLGPVFSKPKPSIVRVAQKQPPRVIVKNVEPKETTDPFAGPPQPKETFVVSDILFEFDKDELRPEFMDLLKRLVAYLNKPPVFKSLLIEGHTDYIGLPEYNLDLSQRRAGRVKSTLISMGLSEAKIRSVGYGATRPVANNGNYQGRALNRRVEFKVER